MTQPLGPRASQVFLALSSCPPEQRAAMLERECGDDAALRVEVEQLLAALDGPDGPLDVPVMAPGQANRWLTVLHAPGEGPSPADPLPTMGTEVGGFTLLDVLGTGGTGVVYRALQRRPARTVALKLLRDGLTGAAVRKRFEVEAEILGRLQHPGIAQVYAAHPGDDSTRPFIAMELVEGQPITEFADDRGLAVPERVSLLARVCDAVQHAHQRGVIHRDLKPANVLVTTDGQPKVLDFGVARAEGGSPVHSTVETEAGQLLGTVPYMSPEQVRASPDAIDTRTDVYALGVMLFRLVAGRLPFSDDDPSLPELARRIEEDSPPRLSSLTAGIAADLETIAARALAKDKDRRYASAADLGADLGRFIAGQPIAASADSAWYVLRTRVRRYRRALAAVSAAMLLLTGLAAYATVQRTRAQLLSSRLERELSASNIERGRLLSLTGNHRAAETLVWRELLAHPESTHARWAAADLYSRQPALWSRIVDRLGATTAQFSPDGRRLLVAANEGPLVVLDASTGASLLTLRGHTSQPVRAVFLGERGDLVVSSGRDRTLRVWDAGTGELRHVLQDAPSYAAVAALSGGGRVAVASLNDVRIYDAVGGRFEVAFTPGSAPVRNLAAGQGQHLGMVLNDGTAAIWDADRVSQVASWRAHPVQCASIAFSPDGTRVATSAVDGSVRVWDARTLQLIREFDLDGATARVVAFSPDGKRLAAAGWWRVMVWPLDDTGETRALAVSLGAMDLAFAPDGRTLATVDEVPGRAYVWEIDADPRVARWKAHDGRVSSLVVGRDARWLITGSFSGEVRRWDLGVPRVQAINARPLDRQKASNQRPSPDAGGSGARWLSQDTRVRSLASSGSGAWVAAAGVSERAVVFDGATGAQVAELPIPSGSAVVEFDGDEAIYVGESDGTVTRRAWREPSHPVVRWSGDRGEVLDLLAWPGHVAVAHRRLAVDILDSSDGRVLQRLSTDTAPFSLARSADGRFLAVGTWSGTVDVWDTRGWLRVASLRGHARMVGALDFSPDGRLLASASREGHARVWEVGTWSWLTATPGGTSGVEAVRFLPDSRHLVIGTDAGEVAVVDLHHFDRHVDGNEATQRALLARDEVVSTPISVGSS